MTRSYYADNGNQTCRLADAAMQLSSSDYALQNAQRSPPEAAWSESSIAYSSACSGLQYHLSSSHMHLNLYRRSAA